MALSLGSAAIKAKLRAMKTEFLTSDEWDKIAQMDRVEDVTELLSNHRGYEDLFDFASHGIHRTVVEQQLMLATYKDFVKIYHFSNMRERQFLSMFMEKYEINAIKNMLHKHLGMNDTDLKKNMLDKEIDFFDRYGTIPLRQMYEAQSTNELIELLRDTKYYTVLKPLLSKHEYTPFECDLLLDNYHHANVLKISKKSLNKKNYARFKQAYGELIDLTNIAWIARGKRYYDMNEVEIYSIILPIQSHLPQRVIKGLIDSKDMDEFNQILKNTYYKKFATRGGIDNITAHITPVVERVVYAAHEKEDDYLALVTLYLHHRDMEKTKIIQAIEAARYNIKPGDLWNKGGNSI